MEKNNNNSEYIVIDYFEKFKKKYFDKQLKNSDLTYKEFLLNLEKNHYKKLYWRKKLLISKFSSNIFKKNNIFLSSEKEENFILNDFKKYSIIVNNLFKYFLVDDKPINILKNINLKILKGEFIVILGPSGSGKSTLLNIISGLDFAEYGDVYVHKYNINFLKDKHLTLFRQKYVGFIFQQYNLLNNLTVRENVEIIKYLTSNKKVDPLFSVDNMLNLVDLKKEENKFPSQLSGGQQQRVSIARALVKNPEILFCDEPTGALDEKISKLILEKIVEINKNFKTTIIFVTHNVSIANIADRVIYMKNGKINKIVKNKIKQKVKDLVW